MEKFRVAIFAGEIPPPTFIDRLINGLAEQNTEILLTGHLRKKVLYASTNIKIVGYSGRISKLWILLKYTFLLLLYKPKAKKKLDEWIHQNATNANLAKIRYYPILYFQPDIFHLQWIKSISDWVWVNDFKIKLVVSLRGAHVNYTPICEPAYAHLYRENFPKVDGFHGVSNNIVQEAIQYHADPKKAKVIYSGLDLNQFHFQTNKPKSQNLQIISVGRNHWIKGYRYALDAMKLLKSNNISFTYTIIGIQDDEELFFQRAQLDLLEEVIFEKSLPFHEITKRMSNARLLLLPSLEEGLANVVLEAMALGTIVVTTDCGGMAEVIDHLENGFLVDTRNPQEIADAISTIDKMPQAQYESMVKSARNKIEANHTEEQMIEGMLTLYNQVYEAN